MTQLSFFAIIFFSLSAMAESSIELTCKAQAKDIAVQTYSNCMTEARNSQIEQIRKSYKEELAGLKSKYDQELKKVSGAAKAAKNKLKSAPAVEEVEVKASSRSSKTAAKQLPSRKAGNEAASVQEVTESAKSEQMTNKAANGLEKEAADADNGVQVIDMPTEESSPTI